MQVSLMAFFYPYCNPECEVCFRARLNRYGKAEKSARPPTRKATAPVAAGNFLRSIETLYSGDSIATVFL